MENKIIDTIEINGKMVEVPRAQKLFERDLSYYDYLEEIAKQYFSFDVEKDNMSEEEYEDKLDEYVQKLCDAADEKSASMKKAKREERLNSIKNIFKRNKKEEELDSKSDENTEKTTDSKDKNEKEEKKTTVFSKLPKPIKFIGKVLLLPVKLVLIPVKIITFPVRIAWKGIKAISKGLIFAGKTLVKGVKKVNSLMPWSKNKQEIDQDKILEEAMNAEKQGIDQDKILDDAQEELKAGVNEQLAKDMIEKLNKQIEQLKEENERLTRIKTEDEEEKQILRKRIEIAKKQPERDKIWEQYSAEEKAKEISKMKIENAEKAMDDDRYRSFKPSLVLNNSKPAITLNTINEYRDSQILSETSDTVTITAELYENLIYSEYELNIYMRDMAVKAYKIPFYTIDYNYDGLIKRNKEIVPAKDFKGSKVFNHSFTITKERYKKLLENADKYFKLMGELSELCPDEFENEQEKKLVK